MASTSLNVAVTPVVSVEGLVLFPVILDSKIELTTDDANLIDMTDCLVSKAYAPQMAEAEFWASSAKRKAVKSNKGGTVTYVIPSIRPELKQRVLGAKKTASGITVQGSSNVSPEYICAHAVKLTDDITILEKVGKVVFSTPGETAQTGTESISFQTAELVGTIVPLTYEVEHIDGKTSGDFLFSIDSESTEYAVAKTDWFSKGTAGIVKVVAPSTTK